MSTSLVVSGMAPHKWACPMRFPHEWRADNRSPPANLFVTQGEAHKSPLSRLSRPRFASNQDAVQYILATLRWVIGGSTRLLATICSATLVDGQDLEPIHLRIEISSVSSWDGRQTSVCPFLSRYFLEKKLLIELKPYNIVLVSKPSCSQ